MERRSFLRKAGAGVAAGAVAAPALAADLGPLFAEVSMYALMAAVLAFRPAGLFSAKA